jgi:predicted small secreted protein
MRNAIVPAVLIALLPLTACKTVSSAANGVKSAGEAVASGVGSVPSLVNVNLSNVLNNLALDLKIDKANIPINAQIPINIAANICGVSINILSIGGGGKSDGCTANSISPELKQYIQEQLAANGSVGGGAQTTTGTTSATGTTTATTPTTTAPVTTAPVTTAPATTTTPTTTTPTTDTSTPPQS